MSLHYDSLTDLPAAVQEQAARKLRSQIAQKQAEPKKQTEPTEKKKRTKYGNQKAVRGQLVFDSQKEARRYDQLMMMKKAGQITDLKLQPEFTLAEGFRDFDGKWKKALKYRADFSYKRDGELVVEDVKSVATKENRTYQTKKKMLRDLKGIIIQEV